MRLAEHTTTTAADAFDDVEVALIPTGSTEQHGPALPLGTDFLAARAIAGELEDRDDVAVLPTVPVGVSDHHRQYDGTLSVDPEVFEWYVRDVASSMANHGIRKGVFVNGHGGNTDALRRAARDLRAERTVFVAPWDWWDALDGLDEELFDGGIGHADEMESSMVLSIAENLVRESALEDAEAGASDSWGASIHGADLGFDTADFSESGAVGTPTEATAEAGDRLFERSTEELAALVDWLGERDVEDLWPAEHR
jgi:creatinine amidohydrolase